MINTFDNKTVLVTGASRGIGRATAEKFASLGASVALVSRNESEVMQAAEAIKNQFSEIKVFAASVDISKEDQVVRLFRELENRFSTLNVVVNNAGTYVVAEAVDQTLEDWNRVIDVNLTGPFLCSREFFRHARNHPGPARSIVNISSLAGIRGIEKFPGFSAYSASKFGLIGLTECLAAEGKTLGVRVNALAPGAVDTEMLRKGAPHLKALAKPEDLANTIVQFADENTSGYITGSILEIFTNASPRK